MAWFWLIRLRELTLKSSRNFRIWWKICFCLWSAQVAYSKASLEGSFRCKFELASPKRPVWHTRVQLPRLAAQQCGDKNKILLFPRVRSIGKSGFRFWISDFGFPNKTRNRRTEILFHDGFQLRGNFLFHTFFCFTYFVFCVFVSLTAVRISRSVYFFSCKFPYFRFCNNTVFLWGDDASPAPNPQPGGPECCFVWPLPADQSGRIKPAPEELKAPVGTALGVVRTHKAPRPDKAQHQGKCYKTIPRKWIMISCHLRFFEILIFRTNFRFPKNKKKSGFRCIVIRHYAWWSNHSTY